MSVHEMKQLSTKIDALKAEGLYKEVRTVEGANGAEIIINGKKVINLSSNNYLGFATHPRLIEAAKKSIDQYGVGAGAVRPIVGNLKIHDDLEEVLALFKREEAVLVFQSGFNCNAGVIQAVTDEHDLILSDELNHASIIDGSRLSKAKKMKYNHSDMNDLEKILEENRNKFDNVLIITDGVFSMDGDIAKLPEIVELAEKFACMTYVDDAHSSGVLGESGRGTVDHFKLHGRVDFTIGTLSKAIGVVGGYVAGKKISIDWLKNRARPFLFSTGMPPAAVGACIEAIKMLSETTQYTDLLWENTKYFKEKMEKLGFNAGHSETPITPILVGDEKKAGDFSRKLLEAGVFVSPIVFPTVPKGTARLRCMVTAGHSKTQLDSAISTFEKIGKELCIL